MWGLGSLWGLDIVRGFGSVWGLGSLWGLDIVRGFGSVRYFAVFSKVLTTR